MDAEEMRGPPQRTATPTPVGEPSGEADRPAIQHADPPNMATQGSGEASTAGQPDTEPEGPMPDTECEDGLRPPSIHVFCLENKCLWLKYPLWLTRRPQDLNSHPQEAIQAHKKQCNAITESWISGVPNSTRSGLN